jgi:hypothetical protein
MPVGLKLVDVVRTDLVNFFGIERELKLDLFVPPFK